VSNFRPEFLGDTSKWQRDLEKRVQDLSRSVQEQQVLINSLRKELALLQRKV
jgi:uncharacterized coiled-coil protein SlyX